MRTLFTLIFSLSAVLAFAQWNTNGINISNSNSGNVGIGTSSPEAKFTISQAGDGWNDGLRINRDASNYLTLTEDVTDIRLKNWGSGGILFFTSSAEVMRILNNGNVGIGTSNPQRKLEVMGDISLPSSSGNKQIFTWSPDDNNWRIGMSISPGFTVSMATTHVQYITYAPAIGQGFAVGVNGGESSFEITGSNHNAFFRGKMGIGTVTPSSPLHVKGSGAGSHMTIETDQN